MGLKFSFLFLEKRDLLETYSNKCHKILLCTIIKETEHE